jgi:general stress protein 26
MTKADDTEVGAFLDGAARLAASVPTCWLVTRFDGHGNARPMGRLLPDPQLNDWKILFVTDGRSRKTAQIRQAGRVELIFQRDADDAFASFAGLATVVDDRGVVERLWKSRYDVYFPTAQDRANAAFLEIAVDRMDLWIRGVTQEPFGVRPTILERQAGGHWRLKASPN